MKSLGKSTDCHVAITILEIKRVKILTFKIFHPILMQFVFYKMMGNWMKNKKVQFLEFNTCWSFLMQFILQTNTESSQQNQFKETIRIK
jgi:hypothetical protein